MFFRKLFSTTERKVFVGFEWDMVYKGEGGGGFLSTRVIRGVGSSQSGLYGGFIPNMK